jgi:uncharacterized membrane protein
MFAVPRSMTDPAGENIRTIVELERQAQRESSLGERVGDAIRRFVGSMSFVTLHTLAMLAWIAWNMAAVPDRRFDPYPFGLLTFIVSLEGVLIATFVLIAQNRMSRQSEERAQLNLQIDLLAEQENSLVLKMLRRISERLDIPPESEDEARAEKLTEQTNVYELMSTLRREKPNRS